MFSSLKSDSNAKSFLRSFHSERKNENNKTNGYFGETAGWDKLNFAFESEEDGVFQVVFTVVNISSQHSVMSIPQQVNQMEDLAFCEGSTIPLESNRTGELAMECWNLRKTIMEQSSTSIKYKREILGLKNLVKSLQKCITEIEAESLAKTKDIHAKKTTILQCEKKIHELTTNNTFVTSSFNRNKKLTHVVQHKLEETQKENALILEKL